MRKEESSLLLLKLTFPTYLKYKVEASICLYNLKQFADVVVTKLFHSRYLCGDAGQFRLRYKK